jgi:hypothetical protein
MKPFRMAGSGRNQTDPEQFFFYYQPPGFVNKNRRKSVWVLASRIPRW